MNDPINRFAVEEYLWQTPHLTEELRRKKQAQNKASLDRKITYCLRRPNEKLQFQSVEGWTSGQILAYMQERGIPRERILKNLHRTSDW